MSKNQIVILVVALVLILILIAGWIFCQKQKSATKQEEVLSLSGVVTGVNIDENFLTVKPSSQNIEVKVILLETSRLVRLEFPFDPKNPPKETTFTPQQKEIKLEDFEVGDNVFIKVKENIAGKTEFDNVDFVYILP